MSEFGILMVCTGNTCRSPLAEQMLTAALTRSLESAFGLVRGVSLASQVRISSAGTGARDGEPMAPGAIAESERHGADGRDHRAHLLGVADVQSADLILAMTQEHRRAVAQLDPRAARRSFTLTEFARILAFPGTLDGMGPIDRDDLAGTLTTLVPAVAASRGYLPPASDAELDIVDPWGKGARVYSQVASIIGEATTTLADSFVNVLRDT